MITDTVGLPLAIKTADCLPILLYDTRLHIIAAAHAGWRGTVGHIAEKVVKAIPSRPEDLHAILGPCISQAAFEVGDEVYDAFLKAGFPMDAIADRNSKLACDKKPRRGFPMIAEGCNPRWHISLRKANAWLLRECGVSDIFVEPACTFASPSLYSARRSGIETGRNLNVITLVQAREDELALSSERSRASLKAMMES